MAPAGAQGLPSMALAIPCVVLTLCLRKPRAQGYAGRDSLILPLILGAVTLLLLLAVCACYAVKRRRQKTLRRKTIGKISSDLQSGDKATLLPDGSEEE